MSNSKLASAISAFGAEVKAKLSNPAVTGQPEDQLRAPMETLIKNLAEASGQAAGLTQLVGETKHAETGSRPDYSVTVNGALTGFIELKAPGKGANPKKFSNEHDKTQWAKFQRLPNLLYSDGNAFSLWRDGERQGPIVELDGDVEEAGAKLAAPDTLLALIHDFLTWTPIVPKSARELAPLAARLCRFLRDETLDAMQEPASPLLDLAEDWHLTLLPDASHERFADNYAQAVTFGFLMARSRGLALDGDLDAIARKLGLDTLIGAALRSLSETAAVPSASIKALTRILGFVDWNQISRGDPEAWLYFYETFLEVYDNKLRKLTGSYYTPPEVVTAMVRLADEALKAPGRFGIHQGLAAPQVHIADPAMGSGTYLLALVRHIAAEIERDQGPGAVAGAMAEAVKRLYGFELQFGAFAVAQLRLIAEMLEIGATATPQMFVTDTLGDPYEQDETGTGIGRQLSRSRVAANKIKQQQPITVVIGNPPYKEKMKGHGAWVEKGSALRPEPILDDWQPPSKWGVGAHAKHLRNLYVYFWRWAAWKVFEQGGGGRDKTPPIEEKLSGLVCYITVSGFLNGPGFQKMRADLRRDCDDIWVIDCSPEGHQPEVGTRIFQGVQQPICIVLASRSPGNDPKVPAKVRFLSLDPGDREDKFKELAKLSITGTGWKDAALDWRAPFLPEFSGAWADFIPLDKIVVYAGPGVTAGRTWVIAPDRSTLERRWNKLLTETDPAEKEILFHPTLRKDKKTGAYQVSGRHIRKIVNEPLGQRPIRTVSIISETILQPELVSYGFRSFDRQYVIADTRVLSDPRPKIWNAESADQVYMTAPMDLSPSSGPSLTITAQPPDKHHYSGRGGHVFPLSQGAATTQTNVTDAAIATLSKQYGSAVDPVDIFAYVAALLASPAYTEAHRADLIRPGLRVPLTADKALFGEASALGREVIWLHTFGERMAEGQSAGEPRLPEDRRPYVPTDGAIPSTPEGFPDTLEYEPENRRLKVGQGHIDNVTPSMWAYEVSGKNVLRQWFSYRKRNRERPQIGDRREPSPLGKIQPEHWLSEYTGELLNVLNVLGLLIDLEPKQADLLKRIEDGPLIPASKLNP
ncbi:MAG TPA: type ISP restriction/modification enzyme [Allosphingosinicella sp.]